MADSGFRMAVAYLTVQKWRLPSDTRHDKAAALTSCQTSPDQQTINAELIVGGSSVWRIAERALRGPSSVEVAGDAIIGE